jgi:hypothetical protein
VINGSKFSTIRVDNGDTASTVIESERFDFNDATPAVAQDYDPEFATNGKRPRKMVVLTRE